MIPPFQSPQRPAAQLRRGYTRLTLTSWWVFSVAASFALNARERVALPTAAVGVMGLYVAMAVFAEGVAMVLVLGAAKWLWHAPKATVVARVGALAIVAAVAGFLQVTALSWLLRSEGLGFLSVDIVVAALTDVHRVSAWLTWAELRLLLVWGAGAAGVAVLLFWSASPLTARSLTALTAAATTAVLGLGAVARNLPANSPDPAHARLEAALRVGVVPNARLWSTLLWPKSTPVFPPEMALDRREARAPATAHGRRPNVLMVSFESLREGEAEQLTDGRPVMPTLARLAREGIHFTRAYATSNESAYSLASVLTSTLAPKTPGRDDFLSPARPHIRIADLLADTHATAVFSAAPEAWQHMDAVSRSPSLDRFVDASTEAAGQLPVPISNTGHVRAVQSGALENGNLDDAVPTRAFEAWIEEHRRTRPQFPFFALVKFESSHFPYEQGFNVPQRFTGTSLTDHESSQLAFFRYPQRLATKMRRRYWNSLAYDDQLLTEMLDRLQSLGLLDDTVVILFGDHGELFHENGKVTHAAGLYEKSLHVELVVWGAKTLVSRTYEDPVSLLDVGPIVLREAGLPPFRGFQGRVPKGLDEPNGSGDPVRPIFSAAQHAVFEDSVLVGRWRYVRQSDGVYEHLFDVVADDLERSNQVLLQTDVAECLYHTTMRFRQAQLGYYAQPGVVRPFFPPQHGLAAGPACAWATAVR